MRVLLFSTAYIPLVGGAEIAMKEVTDRLPDIEFELITPRYSRRSPKKELVGNILTHRVGPGFGALDKWLLPLLGPREARRLHTKNPFDIIHGIMATFGGLAAARFKEQHSSTPMLLTLQEGQPPEKLRERTRFFSGTYQGIFNNADHVSVISSFLGEYATSMRVRKNNITQIPNGVPFEQFSRRRPEAIRAIRSHLRIPDDAFVVVTTSRLEHKNGVDTLLKAFARFKRERERKQSEEKPRGPQALLQRKQQYKLLIAGDGSDRDILKVAADRLDIAGDTYFLGTIPHEDLPPLLWASNVFVRLSRSEGLGNSFLEAMAAGIPVIGTPVGGIPDFLTDTETGLVVPPDDPEAASEALLEIEQNESLYSTMVDNARSLVRNDFNWDTVAEQYNALYNTLT